MYILVDSREKPHAIGKILDEFQMQGIPYDITKLYIGDYMDYGNPRLVVDRKQNIGELASNCTGDRDRFKRELDRAVATGTEIVVLVEQSTYSAGDKRIQVKNIEDLMLWSSPYSTVPGERLYRVLASWTYKYPLRVEFCRKADTGKRIIEILEGGK